MMGQVLGSLTLMWVTQMEFQSHAFGLVQPQLLQTLRERTSRWKHSVLALSASQMNKIKQKFKQSQLLKANTF